jgi:hypothetical protein
VRLVLVDLERELAKTVVRPASTPPSR